MIMNEIIFVRHGETDYNIQRRLAGWSDVPLNKTGVNQAKTLASHLFNIHFDIIESSDLIRCLNFSKIISRETGIKITKQPLLRERDFGDHEGKTLQELGMPFESYEDMVRHFFECNCHRGQTVIEYGRQMHNFLDEISLKYSERRIIASTHGGAIMTALCTLFGEPLTFENGLKYKHENGYVSYLKLDKGFKVIDSLINVQVSKIVNYLNKR